MYFVIGYERKNFTLTLVSTIYIIDYTHILLIAFLLYFTFQLLVLFICADNDKHTNSNWTNCYSKTICHKQELGKINMKTFHKLIESQSHEYCLIWELKINHDIFNFIRIFIFYSIYARFFEWIANFLHSHFLIISSHEKVHNLHLHTWLKFILNCNRCM